jgi:ArsR family transcriptional regulator
VNLHIPSAEWHTARPLYQVKADMFKGLAHPIRVRLLELIVTHGEVAVGQLLDETGLQPPTLSQHLAVLRRHGLVDSERRASSVVYRVSTPAVAELLRTAREFLVERLEITQDRLDATGSLPAIGASDRPS